MNEDESRTRSRVSKACTRCRTRKDRCDGTRPACLACLTAGKDCVYDAANKKRGLQEGYVRGLEKLFALATQGITGLEDALVDLMHNETLRGNWTTNAADEFHLSHWKDSRTQRELEGLLSGVATAGEKRKRGEDENDEESPLDLVEVLASEIGLRYCVETVRKTIPEIAAPTVPPPSHDRRLPGNARMLLDHYFTYVHCWLPFLSRPHVLRAFYAMSRSPVATDCTSSIVWAILAYTVIVIPENSDDGQSRQTSETDIQLMQIRDSTQPNQRFDLDKSAIQLTRIKTSSEYRQIAHDIIHAALMSHQTSHQELFVCAQCLLLLALLDLGNSHPTTAWVYANTAIAVGSTIPSSGQSNVEADSVRGFRQAALMIRAAISLQLKECPSTDSPAFCSTVYKAEDGYDEWEPWSGSNSSSFDAEPSFAISIFNRSTRVFKILAEISSREPTLITSSNVQLYLENLHHARRNDSVARLSDPSGDSPPHHVFFMMFHLMVQLHLVSIPTYHETGNLERARLACNAVGLLEICSTSSKFALSHVPPLLSSILRLASQQARSVRSTFGEENALPGFYDFSKAMSEHQDALSSVWPIFGFGREEPQEDRSLNTDFTADTDQVVAPTFFRFADPTATHLPNLGVSSSPLNLQTLSPQAVNAPSSHGDHVTTPLHLRNQSIGSVPSPTYPMMSSITYQQSTLPLSGSPSGSGTGLFQTRGTLPATISDPMLFPNTSPSHQGDSLDAIFNEMAYLDTNDWNFERNSDLRDFGFSDDVAFQAFCNDPDRVNAPGGIPQMSLSSNRQSWAFTEHGYDKVQQ